MYPDFQLPEVESCWLCPQKLKEQKKKKLAQLLNAIACGEPVKITTKYHVLLPTEEAHHSFHETKGAAGYAQRIHPKLVEKIYELVSEGITDTQEVKRALKHYTLHDLCPDQKPELVDRAYYPTNTDIRNHVYKAQRACQLSKLDQENLRLKIEQWQKQTPQSHFHFCPYKSTIDSDKESLDGESSYTQILL